MKGSEGVVEQTKSPGKKVTKDDAGQWFLAGVDHLLFRLSWCTKGGLYRALGLGLAYENTRAVFHLMLFGYSLVLMDISEAVSSSGLWKELVIYMTGRVYIQLTWYLFPSCNNVPVEKCVVFVIAMLCLSKMCTSCLVMLTCQYQYQHQHQISTNNKHERKVSASCVFTSTILTIDPLTYIFSCYYCRTTGSCRVEIRLIMVFNTWV